MSSEEEDYLKKEFNAPSENTSGLYIYRDMRMGSALKKEVFVNDQSLGKTAPMTFFYTEVAPGKHKVSTQSEFGLNHLELETEAGKNYFIRQYIKMGFLVGGSALKQVSEEKGRNGVLRCNLAEIQTSSIQ